MTVVKNQEANLAEILRGHQDAILDEWLKVMNSSTRRADLIKDSELRSQTQRFLKLLSHATETAGNDIQSSAWNDTKEMLNEISRSRATRASRLRRRRHSFFLSNVRYLTGCARNMRTIRKC